MDLASFERAELLMLDSLGVEMILHILSGYCYPLDILRVGSTKQLHYQFLSFLPLSLSRFPLGCRVCVRREGRSSSVPLMLSIV